MSGTPKLVTVASYVNAWEARIASGRLESEGISIFIADENYVLQNWAISQALGGVKIQVLASDVDEARKVIAALNNGEYALFPDTETERNAEPACSKCGSHDIKTRFSLRSWVLMLGTLAAGAGYPARRNMHQCQGCGHKWRE
ncbi:MAG: putative signal transducing protein [Gammaproteobacteria bacterium]